MKKIIEFLKKVGEWVANTRFAKWLTTDTKWTWLLVALAIGFWADSFYCAAYAGGVETLLAEI